jgi:hypothetical protein
VRKYWRSRAPEEVEREKEKNEELEKQDEPLPTEKVELPFKAVPPVNTGSEDQRDEMASNLDQREDNAYQVRAPVRDIVTKAQTVMTVFVSFYFSDWAKR